MFYAHIVLAKKGPLARIWLAAHWDKKITKAHVFETNIEQSVEGIMQPKVKLALRTSGHLLLGVVRIYSRKAKYLLADCNEAFVKIKMAFRPGMVDLPEENREAAVNAITLPEVFHDFDTTLPELNDVDIEEQFSINQSRADEITMREDYGTLPMSIHEDGFGDMGFDADTPDLARDEPDPNIDENLFAEELGNNIDLEPKEPVAGTSRDMLDSIEPHHALSEDGFGDEFGQPAAGLFEGDIFADAPLATTALPPGAMTSRTESDDDMDFDAGAPSPPMSSYGSRPNSPVPGTSANAAERCPSINENPLSVMPPMSPHERIDPEIDDMNLHPENIVDNLQDPAEELLNADEESFALAPVDATALKGVPKTKRKRKLIVDEVKNISGEEMKSQLANTSDIVTTLDLAPPTKRLMYWKETGGVEKLFALPSRDIPARALSKNYQRHLTSRAFGIEDFSALGPADVLALEQNKPEEQDLGPKRGRKRRMNQEPVIPDLSLPEPEYPREYELPQNSAMELRNHPTLLSNDESIMPPPVSMNEYMNPQTPSIPQLSPNATILQMPQTPFNNLTDVSSMNQMPQTPGFIQMPETPIMPQMPPHPDMQQLSPTSSMIQTPGMVQLSSTLGLDQMPQTPGMLHMPPPSGMTHMPSPPTHHLSYMPMTPGVPMTPGNLMHGNMTPGLHHVDDRMPDSGLMHEGMGQVDLHHGSMTPGGLDHGGMTPHHAIENMESIPNLPADQVSSILNGTGMENIGYANMGFDGPHTSPRGTAIANDWNDDYDYPQSPGHEAGEEQLENETDEQFEERVLNKRAAQMFITVKQKLLKRESIYLSEMTVRNQKKQAAQKFYSLLVLKKFQAIQIKQKEPYGDILVTKGLMFDNPTL